MCLFGQSAGQGRILAKPNYSFEKRQRDLEKKRKQEEKRLRKLADRKGATDESPEAATDSTDLEDPPPMGF